MKQVQASKGPSGIDGSFFSVWYRWIVLSPLKEKGGMKMKQTTDFLKMKQTGNKIVMVTAYDYPSAKHAEQAEADMILVGDSLGMVVLGYDSTVPVTMEDMIHHSKAVRRGAGKTFTGIREVFWAVVFKRHLLVNELGIIIIPFFQCRRINCQGFHCRSWLSS